MPHSVFLSWPEDDQDKALAFQREQAMICQGCGTREVEWQKDRFAYVSQARICPGCELLEQERNNIPKNSDGSLAAQGVKLFLVRNSPEVANAPDIWENWSI